LENYLDHNTTELGQ